MMRKKSFCLSILCLICFFIGFIGLNTAYAMQQTVIIQGKIEGTGFNNTQWQADDNGDAFAFVSESRNYESTVTTKNAIKGSYSVAFNASKIANAGDGGNIQLVVALGADKKEQIPLNSNDAYFNTKNSDTVYLAFAGTKIYIFDRSQGDGNPSYIDKEGGSGVNELGTSYWKHVYNFYSAKSLSLSTAHFKFEVVDDEMVDTIKVYVAGSANFADNPDCTVTLHQNDVANGFLQFSQPISSYVQGLTNSHCINNLKINGDTVNKDDLEILGDENKVAFIDAVKSTMYDSGVDSKIISKFKVSDADVESAEEVFSLKFDSKRFATETNDHYWGLVFGVDESGDLSTGSEIKFNRLGTSNASINGGICAYHCTVSTVALTPLTYTIKGYKGGRVEVTYNDYSSCSGHTSIYENIDLNGKVAFKIFNSSEFDNGYWEISNVSFSFSGLIEKALELKIGAVDNPTLIVGDSVKLTTNMECKLDVIDGEEVATLDGDVLTALTPGTVVVKATMIDDESVSALFSIEVTDEINYNYEYKNEFESIQDINNAKNTSDFYVVESASGNIEINNSLNFRSTVGNTPAQVGLIVPFTHNYQSGTVFDITFTVTIENANKDVRNQNYYCGFAFGLDEIGSNPLGESSGALLINCVKSEIYKDGVLVKPTYVTQNQPGAQTTYASDYFGCYADSTCPLTVRLVAKSDGTLEYYRGIVYKRFGQNDIGTYVSDLFATYSGFDFNGYVSMFTNNSTIYKYTSDGNIKEDSCEVKFDNLIVNGNYRMDKDMVPEVKGLGIERVDDLLHTELPIILDYYIYTVPNLKAYHDYTVEVISGNASIDSQNRLVTTGAGTVKLKITSLANPASFKEIELNIGELKIESISLDKDLFKNLTNDSQAFYINAKLVGENTYIAEYLKIEYEVIEGPVSIINGYLYINGTGNAKIRVYSHYLPSVENIVEFSIADGDIQYQAQSQWGITEYALYIGIPALAIAIVSCVIIIIKKNKKREK